MKVGTKVELTFGILKGKKGTIARINEQSGVVRLDRTGTEVEEELKYIKEVKGGMPKRKLKNVWHQLDRACGELENASHTMSELGMDTDSVRDAFENIVARKNEVEEELLKQGGKLF